MNNYTKIDYSLEIEFSKSPAEVFRHVIDLSKWWPEEFVGESIKPDSEFEFKIGDGHYSKNRVIEFVPDKKLVWLTLESHRAADEFDWTGTRFIFELRPVSGKTHLLFIYDGVVPEDEKERLAQICDFCIKDKLYRFTESFDVTIEVAKPPKEVFKSITENVVKWWGGKDLTGRSLKPGDEFVIHHPGAHYSKQQLVEVIPDKRVVWFVSEARLEWLEKNKAEWTNTKMIFEIAAAGDKTILHFTHEGLVPAMECYEKVHQGWNTVITDYLFNYVTSGKVAEQFL